MLVSLFLLFEVNGIMGACPHGLCEMETMVPNKNRPYHETTCCRVSRIILSALQHQNIWEHNKIQLVECFVIIWEEEKKGRENTYI